MKACSSCNIPKPLAEFPLSKNTKDGRHNQCKICSKETIKKHKLNHINEIKKYRHEYYLNNIKHIKEYQKEYYAKNEIDDRDKRITAYITAYNKIKEATSKQWLKQQIRQKFGQTYGIAHSLRTRIGIAIKRQKGSKITRTEQLLGCTIEQLKEHLHKQFYPNPRTTESMAWDNYGVKGWHIDHIKPCASFDLTDPEQQKICFHYTNLQPLWYWENIRKSDT